MHTDIKYWTLNKLHHIVDGEFGHSLCFYYLPLRYWSPEKN